MVMAEDAVVTPLTEEAMVVVPELMRALETVSPAFKVSTVVMEAVPPVVL